MDAALKEGSLQVSYQRSKIIVVKNFYFVQIVVH
jgi:hypothetical protein